MITSIKQLKRGHTYWTVDFGDQVAMPRKVEAKRLGRVIITPGVWIWFADMRFFERESEALAWIKLKKEGKL